MCRTWKFAGWSLLAAVLPACASSTVRAVDFAVNPRLRPALPFTSAAPGDRVVFLAPVRDQRTTNPAERGQAIAYGTDEVWDRPVPLMVGETLASELAESRIFARVVDQAAPQAVVIQPTLVAFAMATKEQVQGASALAEFRLELRVYGPCDAQGQRPLWWQEQFADRTVTEPALQPPNLFVLAGHTVVRGIGKALTGLDGSNVSRSGVPIAPVAAPGK